MADTSGRLRALESEASALRQHTKRLSDECQAARRERDDETRRGEERRTELLALREECETLSEECERTKMEGADAVRSRDAELASLRRDAAADRRRMASPRFKQNHWVNRVCGDASVAMKRGR